MEHTRRAQVTAEFSVALMALVLFLVLMTRMIVWMGKDIVNRNAAFESTRNLSKVQSFGEAYDADGHPIGCTNPKHSPPWDFYNQSNGKKPLNVFEEIR